MIKRFIQQLPARFVAYQKRKQAVAYVQKIYQTIPSFNLAKTARENQQLFSYEYIYGEIDFTSFAQLLSRCTIVEGATFYDLGSGAGKAVMLAALLYEFKKVVGVEQLQLLHQCAQQIQQQSPQLQQKNIYLYQTDLLTFDWFEADILFINASAFIGDFWQAVLAKLYDIKSGAYILIVSKRLAEESFNLIYTDFIPMSWGFARVSIYRKK